MSTVVPAKADVVSPLPLTTLKLYAQRIFSAIRRGESVTTIWVPMAGRRIRTKFVIKLPELFKDEIGPKRYLLVYIEPLELTEESTAGYIKLVVKSIIEEYNNQLQGWELKPLNLAEFSTSSSSGYTEALEVFKKTIQSITSQGIEIVLFLGEFDELQFANLIFYHNLKSLWAGFEGKPHFVFLLLEDITKPERLQKFGELAGLLLQNVIYVPLLSDEEATYLIDYFAESLSRPFSQDEKKLLWEICGGHPYLLKSCCRLIALMNGQKVSTAELREMLISHFEPRSACQKIFNHLTSEEQEILRRISSNKISGKLPQEAETLLSLGLIREDENQRWVPFGELFSSVMEKKVVKTDTALSSSSAESISFDEKSGAILVGGTNVEDKFTRQEYEILRFLLQDSGKLRSREAVGEAMWGKESYDKYSDWAIDQVMSKIRKKLKNLGADKVLTTIKGRGYLLAHRSAATA